MTEKANLYMLLLVSLQICYPFWNVMYKKYYFPVLGGEKICGDFCHSPSAMGFSPEKLATKLYELVSVLANDYSVAEQLQTVLF